MSLFKYRLAAGCAAACLAAVAPAQASSTATAQITQFGVELIDLNPGDDIAPSISFDHQIGGNQTIVTLFDGTGWIGQDAATALGQIQLARGDSFSMAFMSSTSVRSSVTAIAQPFATDGGGSAHIAMGFTLSPYTSARFHALGELVANPDAAAGSAHAAVSFSGLMDATVAGFADRQHFLRSKTLGTGAETYKLLGYFETHDYSATGTLRMHAEASAWMGPAMPVPEPGTYAMLAAGLLIIGARRCRQRA